MQLQMENDKQLPNQIALCSDNGAASRSTEQTMTAWRAQLLHINFASLYISCQAAAAAAAATLQAMPA